MKTKRVSIGLYSELKIVFCVINTKMDKRVFKYLTKKKYSFGFKKSTKVKNLQEYWVNVDSIDEAFKLKSKIEKLYKNVVYGKN